MNSNDDLMSVIPMRHTRRNNSKNNNNSRNNLSVNYISNSTPINERPTLNLSPTSMRIVRRPSMLPNVFRRSPMRNSESSRQWGDPPFFTNAKPARMAESGLERMEEQNIRPGTRGRYIVKGGKEADVIVKKGIHQDNGNRVYLLKANDGTIIKPLHNYRFELWDLYRYIKPVRFVPKKSRGGSRKNRKTRRKKQGAPK
jgi:hypothetical protein